MNAGNKRWMIVVGVGLLAAGTSVWALGKAGPALREKMTREMGQKIAAAARLEGDRAAGFMKSWEKETAGRQESRQAVKKALKATVKASREGNQASLKNALDQLQAAVTAALEGQGKMVETLRKELSPEEQSRVLLSRKAHRILRLPGMQQALPALAGFARGEVLGSTPGLSSEARKSLESIGQEYSTKRSDLVQKRLALIEKLEKSGPSSAQNKELLDQIAQNTASLRLTIGDQLAQVRKSVPDAELAKVISSLGKKAAGFRERMKAWKKEEVREE